MRVWDLPVGCLCRNHLLAEHRELHAIWNIITQGKKGYSRHPEVFRWRKRLGALAARHEEQVREMLRRGYRHRSPLNLAEAAPSQRSLRRPELLESLSSQRRRLTSKGCACHLGRMRDD